MSEPSIETRTRFLLKHENYFIARVSYRFPFTFEELKRYRDVLYWHSVGCNTDIVWDTKIVDAFKKELWVDTYLPEFVFNESLPWSIDFIERYSEWVDWGLLAQNPQVLRAPGVVQKYWSELSPHLNTGDLKVLLDPRPEKYDSKAEYLFNDVKHEANRLAHYPELSLQNPEGIRQLKEIDWDKMSQNTLFDWNIELIERYKDLWNWYDLELNTAIPWNLEMMERFEDRIHWPVPKTSQDGLSTSCSGYGVTVNMSVKWTKEMLQRFQHKLDFDALGHNPCTEWDFEMLEMFSDKWSYYQFSCNDHCWNRVFPEFNDREYVIPLLELLRDRMLN